MLFIYQDYVYILLWRDYEYNILIIVALVLYNHREVFNERYFFSRANLENQTIVLHKTTLTISRSETVLIT